MQTSAVAAQGSCVLEHGLSSHGAWLSCCTYTWTLTGPGVEPMSPALAGGFLSTAPPGKSKMLLIID